MANKTIPELDELDFGDIEDTFIFPIDTLLETKKLRLENLLLYASGQLRKAIPVVMDGVTTGDITVDVSSYVPDARVFNWLLKKPQATTLGEQIPAAVIRTPDASTVTIVQGDFVYDAGTYTLLGV